MAPLFSIFFFCQHGFFLTHYEYNLFYNPISEYIPASLLFCFFLTMSTSSLPSNSFRLSKTSWNKILRSQREERIIIFFQVLGHILLPQREVWFQNATKEEMELSHNSFSFKSMLSILFFLIFTIFLTLVNTGNVSVSSINTHIHLRETHELWECPALWKH